MSRRGKSLKVLQDLPELLFKNTDLAGSDVIIVNIDGNTVDLIDAGATAAQALARIKDGGAGALR